MIATFDTAGQPDRRFLRYVLELALSEARNAHKDYLGAPHLFIALMKLDGGCTQEALQHMGFSPRDVADTFRSALGSGKAAADTPILPTRRLKEVLQLAERNAINTTSASIDERAIAQAVLSEHAGVIDELLKKLGIDPAQLSEQVLASDAHTFLELAPPVDPRSAVGSAIVAEAALPDILRDRRRDGKKQEQQQLTTALTQVTLPAGVIIRAWIVADFPAIQRIRSGEGWTSPTQRSAESLLAWQNSWPTLVAVSKEGIVGFVRGLTDGAITLYIAEMAVDEQLRGHGIGRALLSVCHALYPTTRLDLLAVDGVRAFYEACGFKVVSDGMRKSST